MKFQIIIESTSTPDSFEPRADCELVFDNFASPPSNDVDWPNLSNVATEILRTLS